jgi:hypothetical protein
MGVAPVLLDVLEVADVLELLLCAGCAPFLWPWGWKFRAGSALDAAAERALKLIGVPSSLKRCQRRRGGNHLPPRLPFAATDCHRGGICAASARPGMRIQHVDLMTRCIDRTCPKSINGPVE